MKNTIAKISAVLLCVIAAGTVSAQAKKPTLMVVPSDVWCNDNGYMLTFDNQGTKTKIPDYKRALQENAELLQVIGQMGTIMADRGFPLKDMGAAIKTLESESAENAMLNSKSGAGISESPVDKLKKTAKADIIIQLTWKVTTSGPKKTLMFNIQGLDAYTDKQIAGAQGTGVPSMASDVSKLLEEATSAHMNNFTAQLQAHFDDMFANGREIIVRIKKFDSWGSDLETEFNGNELRNIIEDWMAANTLKGRFSTTDATENMMLFENVRIPMFDANNRAIDARQFTRGLQDMLKKAPYSITSKLMTKGLGQAVIVLGEK